MNSLSLNNILSADNIAKLNEIKLKQLCHEIYHIEDFCQISSQFYNPKVQKELNCMLQEFIEKHKNQDLVPSLQDHFSCKNGNQILQLLSLRTGDIDQLVNEAYVGIKYLNDLRSMTSSFKYIYVILFQNDVPYIIEENLSNTQSLDTVFSVLQPDQIGVKTVKSIILQLMVALIYASRVHISNFPMDIVLRPVDKSINAYGWIPVFANYYTAGSFFDGGIENPKALHQDQNEVLHYIMFTLNSVNPELFKLVDSENLITENFFYEILESPSNDIFRYFKVPYARLDVYVKSYINRINKLLTYLENKDIDQTFIIIPVIARYAQLLQDVARKVDDRTRRQLFDDNLTTINEYAVLVAHKHTDQKYIKNFLNLAVEHGKEFQNQQRNIILPNFDTRKDLLTAINNFRKLMINISYFNTTNAIIFSYRNNIGPYPFDFTDAINEAEYIKERFETVFSDNPQIIDKFVETINNDNDAALVNLYETFIEDIKTPLEIELHDYEVNKSPEGLAALNKNIYVQKILASDPIPILGL
jgi:hypothetical protein